MVKAELKPCPFCGAESPLVVGPPDAPEGKVFVGCDSCGGRGPAWPREESAAKFWNRRSSPTEGGDVAGAVEELRAAVEERRRDAAIGLNGEVYLSPESAEAILAALSRPTGDGEAEPIPMVLFCPKCGAQHIDEPEFVPDPGGGDLDTAMFVAGERAKAWSNPPHRSHLCLSCGCIWRPADVATTGVAEIKTIGKHDTFNGFSSAAARPTGGEIAGLREEDIRHAVKRAIKEFMAAGDYGRLLGIDQAAQFAADAILAAAASPSPEGGEIGRGWRHPDTSPEDVDVWGLRSTSPHPEVYDLVEIVSKNEGEWFDAEGQPIEPPLAWHPTNKPARLTRAAAAALNGEKG